jgi:uncharacterized YceG family protein
VTLLALLALVLFGLREADRRLFGGSGGDPGAAVEVTIPDGSSVDAIGDILDRAGVVGNGSGWAIKVRLKGDGDAFKPGTYTLRENENYEIIVASLTAGPPPPEMVRVTVPEGYANRDIARDVAPEAGISPKQYRAAVARASPPPGYRATGDEKLTMEGFMFPATYELEDGGPADDLVSQQLAAFRTAEGQVDYRRARRANLTKYDVLIIASMIEREAAFPGDRRKISAVIWNRLRQNIPLGIDATFQYALGSWEPLTASDLDLAGPYNTRDNHGLPPTAICNPGLASLKAAANPARVNYLYYVAIPGDAKRRHFFTASYDAFTRYQEEHPG